MALVAAFFVVLVGIIGLQSWRNVQTAPEISSIQNQPTNNQPRSKPLAENVGQADTKNWKTYRNEKYGFEVRYPKDWTIQELADSVSWSKSGPTQNKNPGGDFYDGADMRIILVKEVPIFESIKNTRSDLYDYAGYDLNNIKEFSAYGFWGGRAKSSNTLSENVDAIELYKKDGERIFEARWLLYDPSHNGLTAEKYFLPFLSTFKFIPSK